LVKTFYSYCASSFDTRERGGRFGVISRAPTESPVSCLRADRGNHRNGSFSGNNEAAGVSPAARNIFGATLGAAISVAASTSQAAAPTVALAVVGTMLISHLIGIPGAARLAGYVCAIVLVNFNDHPWTYAAYRCAETVLGIATAVVVSFIPKLIKVDESPEPAPRAAETRK
jgi:hypothetical protein